MPNLLIALLATVTIATANAVSFEMRAHGLEQRWQAAQAAGVPAGSLEAARRQVSEERRRRLDGLPYPLVSGAAWNDPLRLPEATTEAAVRAAGDAAHQRAMAAFDRLRDAAGPNGEGAEPAAAAALGAARRPG